MFPYHKIISFYSYSDESDDIEDKSAPGDDDTLFSRIESKEEKSGEHYKGNEEESFLPLCGEYME